MESPRQAEREVCVRVYWGRGGGWVERVEEDCLSAVISMNENLIWPLNIYGSKVNWKVKEGWSGRLKREFLWKMYEYFPSCLAKKGGWVWVWPCCLKSGDSFQRLNQGVDCFPGIQWTGLTFQRVSTVNEACTLTRRSDISCAIGVCSCRVLFCQVFQFLDCWVGAGKGRTLVERVWGVLGAKAIYRLLREHFNAHTVSIPS